MRMYIWMQDSLVGHMIVYVSFCLVKRDFDNYYKKLKNVVLLMCAKDGWILKEIESYVNGILLNLFSPRLYKVPLY